MPTAVGRHLRHLGRALGRLDGSPAGGGGYGGGTTSGDLYPVARHPDGSPVAPSDLPGRTPLDIRLGLTKPEGVTLKLRWGILGSAKICEDWARALADVPGASVVAVAARSANSAAAFASKLGIPKSYGGYEALAADPDVDIVYIGTITALHKAHALMCIAGGKHVLVEKPMSTSKADSEEMFAAAAAMKVMCQEGMWTRYFPAVEHARSLIASGAIGHVQLVQAGMGGLMLGGDKADMLTKRGIGNAMLSCYAVQSAPLAFTGAAPVRVTAGGHMPEGYDVFTSCGATIEFEGEHRPICALTWSMETAMSRRAVIAGSHGRITLEGGAAPTKLTLTTNPKPDAYPGAYHGLFVPRDETVITYALADPAGLRPGRVRADLGGEAAPDFNYPNTHGFVYQGEAIHRCLAAGVLECPQFTAAESLTCMAILDGIEAALRAQPRFPPSPLPQFAGQLPSLASDVGGDLPPEMPLDIKLGLTTKADVGHSLRWGFMTAGRICKDMAMAIQIAQTRGCGATLGAVAARKLVDAEAFASEFGCATAYGGDTAYADICADPSIDIVYVGTITGLHAEHALMALRQGKHVLCEKPFASNGAEVAEMYAAADAAGVLLQEGMWTRFFPATEHARSALAAGAIGQPRTLQATFSDRCYPSQAAPMVFGTSGYPLVATCGGGDPRPHSGGSATLVYPCGGVASVTVPSGGYEAEEEFEICGTTGKITVHTPAHCPTKVTVNGTLFEYPLEPYRYFGGYPQCNQHGFYYEVEAVHRCLAKGFRETPQHTRADSLQLMYIIDQFQAQAGGNAHG